jgi:Ca2+-binding RTX toxin-like protein
MAFSLEAEMGLYFNKYGGTAVFYGGSNLSYGPITGYPLNPDVSVPATHPLWVQGKLLLDRIDTSAGAYYVDTEGNVWVAGPDDGGLAGFYKISRELESILDGSALANGELETITTDAGTFYQHSTGLYIRDNATGNFIPVLDGAVFDYDYPVYEPSPWPISEPDIRTLWETLTLPDGQVYWINSEGEAYKLFDNYYPLGWPPVDGVRNQREGERVNLYNLFLGALLYTEEEFQNYKRLNGQAWGVDASEWFEPDRTYFFADPPPTNSPDSSPVTPESGSIEKIRKGFTVNFGQLMAVKTAYGTSGDDVIDGGGWMMGGLGNDVLIGNAFYDTLVGSIGNDTLRGAAGNDTLAGGDGFDELEGGEGDDLLDGEGEHDVLVGGAGADTLKGGDGFDTVSYEDAQSGIIADLTLGGSQGDAEGDVYDHVEKVVGSQYNDTLIGDNGGNHLYGHGGDDLIVGGYGWDTLQGGDGNDTLVGSTGNEFDLVHVGFDRFIGGAGFDIVSYASSTEGVHASLMAGGRVGYEAETYSGIEGLAGTSGNDALEGDGGANALYGNGGNDNLYGEAGNDTLNGGDGNDYLHGGYGDDTLTGGAGADLLYGTSGFDIAAYDDAASGVIASLTAGGTGGDAQGDIFSGIEALSGSAHGDQLTGDANGNLLSGNGGNDTLNGGVGADTLNGGAGFDMASYADAEAGVEASLAAGAESTGDVFISIEGLSGSVHNDHLVGDAGDNRLLGNAGDDFLEGGVGNDLVDGGEGDDLLSGGAGDDTLNGGAGFDVATYLKVTDGVMVNLADGVASGHAIGNDSLTGIEAVVGSRYDDTLIGDMGDNSLMGNEGSDRLSGGAGADLLSGGAGDDILNGGAGADNLVGGSGWDVASYQDALAGVTLDLSTGGTGGDAAGDSFSDIEAVSGSDHDDQLTGDANGNMLSGNGGDDRLDGADGNDTLNGGAGADVMFGEEGNDALGGGSGDDALDGGNGRDALDGGFGNDRLMGAAGADALFGGEGHDVLDGGSDADTLIGGAGNDALDGGAGDDRLVGGAGSDAYTGGDGQDSVSYEDAQSGIVASLETGGASGDALGDTFTGVETLLGSAFDDRLTGDAGNNTLVGNGGNDSLSGGAGNDVLDGGNGDDTLAGGAGADDLIGGAGFDVATYHSAGSGIVASLAAGGTGGDAAGDTFSRIEALSGSAHNDQLSGDMGSNLLAGNGGADLLDGAEGNDSLDGGTGNDTLTGGAGADVLKGGEGLDVADYSTAGSGLHVSLATPSSNTGDAAGDTFQSIENLNGSLYDDLLTGDGSANDLWGNAGNDTLDGAGGNDTLWGDRGSDVFAFSTSLDGVDNVDRIMEFDASEDMIQLKASIFAGIRSGLVDHAAFTVDRDATREEHRIIYNADTGELFYDADGSGREEQVKFAVVTPGTALTSDHFLMI